MRSRRALPLLLLLAARPAGAARYLCFGDSNTAGDGSPRGAYLGALGAWLETTRPPAEVVNEGVPGETTSDGVTRLEAVLQRTSAEFVLIMEGTNDIHSWTRDPASLDPARTASNLRRMVRAARATGALTLLATVVPRVGDSADPDNSLTRQLNGIIRSVAAGEGAVLAEVAGNVEPLASELTFENPRHPNAIGYALVAEAFAAALAGLPVSRIDLTPPVPLQVAPEPGSERNPLDVAIVVRIAEAKHPPAPESATLLVDGQAVAPVIDASTPGEVAYRHALPQPLRFGQSVAVVFELSDAAPAPGPHRLRLDYSFRATAGNGTGGDIDGTGRIDGGDLAVLAAAFGSGRGDGRYRREADVDLDGVVDGADLAFVAARFGAAP